MSAFQTAAFYELLGNRGGRLDREGTFLSEALARAPLNRVADLACGLGLHAAFMAEQGAEVHASDLSEEMIRHAKEVRKHPRVVYAVGDMCSPAEGPYGLVLCLGNSLSLLSDETKLQQFFAGARRVLAPGGLLITQTLNYDAAAMKKPRIRTEQTDVKDGAIAAVKRFLPRDDTTMLSITYFAATNDTFMDTSETVILRHWSETRLNAAAREAGFDAVQLYGGFDGKPFSPNAPDILLVARTPV